MKRIWIFSLTLVGFVFTLTNSCKKDDSPSKVTPVITWADPADITYGILLSATQLNATADVPGSFDYTPAIGTKLNVGTNQALKAVFTPTDQAAYDTISKSVKINVILNIGDSYQGGKVAYILQEGDPGYIAGETHGFIAAPGDQSTGIGIRWHNGSYIITGATATALGTGNGNTNTIITNQGSTGSYAAKLCADLDLSGYTDWYLPSKDELEQLYINRVAIGGFTDTYYWSSSEFSIDYASVLNFATGAQHNYYKVAEYYVRAVRSF